MRSGRVYIARAIDEAAVNYSLAHLKQQIDNRQRITRDDCGSEVPGRRHFLRLDQFSGSVQVNGLYPLKDELKYRIEYRLESRRNLWERLGRKVETRVRCCLNNALKRWPYES